MAILDIEATRRKGTVKGRESRNQTLNTKLTPTEAAAVEAASEADGKAVGEWLRDLALRELGRDNLQLPSLALMGEITAMRLLLINTLRMILASKTILVEGPSDELIVQKAFLQKSGKMPLEAGVEVITVRALASKRFLDIAKLLDIDTRVVTDNDGNAAAVKTKFADYERDANIKVCYSSDESLRTLENHMVKLNKLKDLNWLFNKSFTTETEVLEYMLNNKTDCALKMFDSSVELVIPEYIQNAIA